MDVHLPKQNRVVREFVFVRFRHLEEMHRVLHRSEELHVKGRRLFVVVVNRHYGNAKGVGDNRCKVWERASAGLLLGYSKRL